MIPKRAARALVPVALAVAACGGDVESRSTRETWMEPVATDAAEVLFAAAPAPGGVAVAGYTDGDVAGSSGGRDALVGVYDGDGTRRWLVQLGGPGTDSALGVSVAPDGSVYAAGYTEGDMAAPNQGSADGWVARFDPNGEEAWRLQFGGPMWDRVFSVVADADGAYLTGYTLGGLGLGGGGEDDALVARVSADGDLIWLRQFGTEATDWGQGGAVAPDGGLYLTGYTEGAFDGERAGKRDSFVARFAPDSSLVWVSQFGSEGNDWTQGIAADADGVVVVGYSDGSLGAPAIGGEDVLVVRITADGTTKWTSQFGSATDDRAFGVSLTDRGALVTGYTHAELGPEAGGEKDGFLASVGSDGQVAWIDQFGGSAGDELYGVAATATGLVVTGYTDGDLAGANQGLQDTFVSGLELP